MFSHSTTSDAITPKPHGGLIASILLLTAVSCFMLSLFLPVYYIHIEDISGYWVLFTGWLGLVFFQFAWYANPLILLAILQAKGCPKTSILLGLFALALASETFLFYEIPTGINQEKMYIKELGIGFFIWYLALILFLLWLISQYVFYRNRH